MTDCCNAVMSIKSYKIIIINLKTKTVVLLYKRQSLFSPNVQVVIMMTINI